MMMLAYDSLPFCVLDINSILCYCTRIWIWQIHFRNCLSCHFLFIWKVLPVTANISLIFLNNLARSTMCTSHCTFARFCAFMQLKNNLLFNLHSFLLSQFLYCFYSTFPCTHLRMRYSSDYIRYSVHFSMTY